MVPPLAIAAGIGELAGDEPALWKGPKPSSATLPAAAREQNTSPLNEDGVHVRRPVRSYLAECQNAAAVRRPDGVVIPDQELWNQERTRRPGLAFPTPVVVLPYGITQTAHFDLRLEVARTGLGGQGPHFAQLEQRHKEQVPYVYINCARRTKH